MTDRRKEQTRRDEQDEREVGITNKPLEEENRNEELTAARRRGQEQGDMPIGTHQGTTTDELEDPVLDVDPGSEAERGAKTADNPELS
jgi:hypothetical protein